MHKYSKYYATIVLTYLTIQLKAWFIKYSVTAVRLKINSAHLNFTIIADRESSKLLNTVYSEFQLWVFTTNTPCLLE